MLSKRSLLLNNFIFNKVIKDTFARCKQEIFKFLRRFFDRCLKLNPNKSQQKNLQDLVKSSQRKPFQQFK